MGCSVRPTVVGILVFLVLAFLAAVAYTVYSITANSSHHHDHDSEAFRSTVAPSLYGASGHGDGKPQECKGPEWECNIRLDPHVYPLHYSLYLHPDFDTALFSGRVSIELNVTDRTDHIRLHSHKLNIIGTSLSVKTGKYASSPIEIRSASNFSKNEFWVVQLKTSINPGTYNLSLEFRGALTPHIVGFYRSQYRDPIQNVTKYVVSSKFQPTFARQAFPCFDEPSFKSTFTVSLVKPSHLVALSNMPVQETNINLPAPNLTTVTFQKSVPMVTYLVAFAIGDFAYKQSFTKSGIPCRIYATSYQVNKTAYASEITPKMVDFYEEYFGVKYPLPKLDIIGIPDFVSGAMEHWGMISFREANLLFQPGVGTPASKQRIAAVVAHELAHMWFGNLMTLKWWDDLWLNEGFASYMEYKGVDAVHPDWDISSQFASSDMTGVLKLDGQQSSHPIVQPVSHPNQITEIFDTISYNKGAAVIRMLENFMGPRNFQQGVTNFLRRYSFKNALTQDLWDTLESETTHLNITFIMDTWTRQMGYPILHVQMLSANQVQITQERFFDNPKNIKHYDENSQPSYRWEIPLLVSTSAGPVSTKSAWIPHTQKSVIMDIAANSEWVKVNTGQLGYYRVQYGPDMLRRIQRDYMMKFTSEERCGLMDDVFSLAFANYTSYVDALEFGKGMSQENHIVPWECVYPHLVKLLHLLNSADANSYAYFRKYIHELSYDQYKRLAWTDNESDPHLHRLLKPKIFALSCEAGLGECRNEAKKMFTKWLNQHNFTIPVSLRGLVYKWGVRQSDRHAWQLVWNRYLHESDATEKITLLKALAYSKEPSVILELLELSKNQTLVRRQDVFILFQAISANPTANIPFWVYYRNSWPELVDRYGLNDRYLGRVIGFVTTDYATQIQLQEIQNFYGKYPESGAGTRARENAYESVINNVAWTQRSLQTISSWLKQNYQ